MREAEPGVSADSLRKQTPGNTGSEAGRGTAMLSDKEKNFPVATAKPSYTPAHALPACISRSDTGSLLLSFSRCYCSQPTLSLLQLPVAGNILQPLPSRTTVCLAGCCWCQPSKTLYPISWQREDGFQSVFLIIARFSSCSHSLGRGSASSGGQMQQGRSGQDASPPAAVQD